MAINKRQQRIFDESLRRAERYGTSIDSKGATRAARRLGMATQAFYFLGKAASVLDALNPGWRDYGVNSVERRAYEKAYALVERKTVALENRLRENCR